MALLTASCQVNGWRLLRAVQPGFDVRVELEEYAEGEGPKEQGYLHPATIDAAEIETLWRYLEQRLYLNQYQPAEPQAVDARAPIQQQQVVSL